MQQLPSLVQKLKNIQEDIQGKIKSNKLNLRFFVIVLLFRFLGRLSPSISNFMNSFMISSTCTFYCTVIYMFCTTCYMCKSFKSKISKRSKNNKRKHNPCSNECFI